MRRADATPTGRAVTGPPPVLTAIRAACAAALLAAHAGFAAAAPRTPALDEDARASREEPPPRILAVVGGTLIDGTGAAPVPDSAVIIEGDRVRAAGPRRQIRIPRGAAAVDATGLTVLPGLVDAHVHLVEGVSLRAFLDNGVTSVRHLGATTLEWITGLRRRVESEEEAGPRIFHCGKFVVSEPPLASSSLQPDLLEQFFVMRGAGDAGEVVRRLVEAGANVLKVKTEMSRECLRALCAAAAEGGLPVTVDNGGEEGFYDAMDAVEAGARGLEHMNGIRFEDPAATEEALRVILSARAFVVPTLSMLGRTISERRLALRESFLRRFVEGGGMVVAGTDTPAAGIRPGEGLHQELARLVAAGLTPARALLAATGDAGRALGMQGLVGTIEAGAYADLLIVRGDPLEDVAAAGRVIQVFKGGRQVVPAPQANGEAQSP